MQDVQIIHEAFKGRGALHVWWVLCRGCSNGVQVSRQASDFGFPTEAKHFPGNCPLNLRHPELWLVDEGNQYFLRHDWPFVQHFAGSYSDKSNLHFFQKLNGLTVWQPFGGGMVQEQRHGLDVDQVTPAREHPVWRSPGHLYMLVRRHLPKLPIQAKVQHGNCLHPFASCHIWKQNYSDG